MLNVVDNGTDGAITFDTAAPDARSVMLSSVAAIVAATVETENKLAETAKVWGANVFSLAFPISGDSVALDTLIGDSKVAAGWSTLAVTDAGKRAKSRMESYFSNARLVAESFATLSDDDKRDIRAGVSSIHYRANLLRKAAADAKKEATKEAKRLEAEAVKAAEDAAALNVDKPTTTDAAPVQTLADVLALALSMIGEASDDDLNAAYDTVAALTDAFDARINAATDAPMVANG